MSPLSVDLGLWALMFDHKPGLHAPTLHACGAARALPRFSVAILLGLAGWPRFGSVTVCTWNSLSGSGFRFTLFL